MKTIPVENKWYTMTELYRAASGSKAKRGLFGYMLKTGRPDHPIFGGAMLLLCGLTALGKNEVYSLRCELDDMSKEEIMAVAEAALAGCFKEYEVSEKEIQKTIKALNKLPPLDRCFEKEKGA